MLKGHQKGHERSSFPSLKEIVNTWLGREICCVDLLIERERRGKARQTNMNFLIPV